MDESDDNRIRALVHPLSVQEFLTQKWPGGFHHFAGDPARLAELIEQSELADISSFVQCPKQGILRADYTREDRPSDADITPERAIQLYKSACTIYMTRLSTAPIKKWMKALDNTFGLLPGTAHVNAFASIPGSGLSWHWDSQENFIVQVRGRKLWHVAPNEYLEWPSVNGQAGAQQRPEVRMQLKNPAAPVEEPKRWQTIEMTPGSVVFLPRGYWHTTENIDESLHLVLQVKLPSWRDVFQFLLKSVPELYSLEWRRPTRALHPDRLFSAGVQEFRERCATLASFASPQGVAALAKLFGETKP